MFARSRNVADKCIEYDVKKMVMILTDMAIAEELEELSRKVKITDMAKLMKKTVPEFKSKNSRSEKYDK